MLVINFTFSHHSEWKPQQDQIFASCGQDGTLRVWDLRTKEKQVNQWKDIAPLYSLQFSQDSETIVCGNQPLLSEM